MLVTYIICAGFFFVGVGNTQLLLTYSNPNTRDKGKQC